MNSKKQKKKKSKRLPRKFPCSCGHIKALHQGIGSRHPWYQWCVGYVPAVQNKYGRSYNCDCERFVPDNLKYLEQQARKKGQGE